MPEHPHILLLGSNNRQGLTLARAFKRLGCLVSSLPLHHKTGQDFSNSILHSFAPNSAILSLAEFESILIEICTGTDISHVIPLDDEALEICIKQYETLSQTVTLCTAQPNIIETATNKAALLETAKSLNIPTPATTVLKSFTDIQGTEIPYPHYLKPSKSATILNQGLGTHAVYYNQNDAEFHRTFRLTIASGKVLIQPPVKGDGIGLNIVAKSGKILAHSCHKRLHQPKNGGGSSYRKTIDAPSKLLTDSQSLIKTLNYTGVGMVEWIAHKGEYYLLEMNCRPWGSLPLAYHAGCNIAQGILEVFSDHRFKQPLQPAKPNVYARNLIYDTGWMLDQLKGGKLHWVLLWPLSLVTHILPNRHFDVESLHDPLPGIMSWICTLRQKTLVRRTKLMSKWRTPFSKWRYAISKGPVAISEVPADKILFICKGNVMRSAFSAKFLGTKRGETVASAGTALWRRRYAIKDAVDVAQSLFGLDMSQHVSTSVTDISYETLKQYHAIYVFDFENYHTLLGYFPKLRRQIRFLDERKIGPLIWPVAIKDPFMSSKNNLQKTFRRIAKLLG